VLADCYSNMGKHSKAAEELLKVPASRKPDNDPETIAYRKIQLAVVRELRLSKSADNVKKARKMFGEIYGTKTKPGWGRQKKSPFTGMTLKEQGLLLEAEGEWKDAFAHWSDLVRMLSKITGRDNATKEFYLESYYHMIFCYLKTGKKDPAKTIHNAGVQIAGLEQNWEDFGSDASKKRFTELLASEPALKEQYLAAKSKKKR
jgi:hypothetical protein